MQGPHNLHVACWNVRTLQDVGVQALIMQEPQKYNVDIPCLLGVRISDGGHSLIKDSGEEACHHLYHSGAVDNSQRHGVAIALSKATPAAVLAWERVMARSHWASSVVGCHPYNGAQTGSQRGSDHAMVRDRMSLRIKAAHFSNRPAKLETAKLKTMALEHLRLDPRNRF